MTPETRDQIRAALTDKLLDQIAFRYMVCTHDGNAEVYDYDKVRDALLAALPVEETPPRFEVCWICKGSGRVEEGEGWSPPCDSECSNCHGTGKLTTLPCRCTMVPPNIIASCYQGHGHVSGQPAMEYAQPVEETPPPTDFDHRRATILGAHLAGYSPAEILAMLTAEAPRTCAWREDDETVWHTDCGHAYVLNEDGPTKNGLTFCGYCGGALVEVPYELPAPPTEDR